MSDITNLFVKQFGTILFMKVQQKGSRLRDTVYMEAGVVGEDVYIEQLGKTDPVDLTTRYQDTPFIDPDHTRRRITMYDTVHNTLLDKKDKLKMLIDPTSRYIQEAAFALGRKMDDRIIAAADATAYTGKDGTTTVTLTAGNIIASSSVGLTLAKLLSAKEILDGNDVDPDEDKFVICSAKQMTNLLNTTEIKNTDYNTVAALAAGKIDTFLGFKFIRSQRLAVNGSSERKVLVYAKSGIGLAMAQDIVTRVDELPTKNYSLQAYASISMGASRLEEEKVVTIACTES